MTIISPASKLQSKISMKMKIIFPITLDICTIPRASKSPYPKKTLAVKNENLLSLFPLTFSLQFLYDTIFGVWKSYLMALGNSHSLKNSVIYCYKIYIFKTRRR